MGPAPGPVGQGAPGEHLGPPWVGSASVWRDCPKPLGLEYGAPPRGGRCRTPISPGHSLFPGHTMVSQIMMLL